MGCHLFDCRVNMIEKLVKEFDIRVGFHGHARKATKPDYKNWDPQFILDQVKNRDPRIGACADTGHWASSGIVPLDAIKLLEGRIISLHLKDRKEIGRKSNDQIYGNGVSNIAGILAELKRQKFQGCIYVEYEENWLNNVPDVRQCLEFIRNPTAQAAPAATPPIAPAKAETMKPSAPASEPTAPVEKKKMGKKKPTLQISRPSFEWTNQA